MSLSSVTVPSVWSVMSRYAHWASASIGLTRYGMPNRRSSSWYIQQWAQYTDYDVIRGVATGVGGSRGGIGIYPPPPKKKLYTPQNKFLATPLDIIQAFSAATTTQSITSSICKTPLKQKFSEALPMSRLACSSFSTLMLLVGSFDL